MLVLWWKMHFSGVVGLDVDGDGDERAVCARHGIHGARGKDDLGQR